MNSGIVTTGLVPFVYGSVEVFQLDAWLDGLHWDLTGGSVQLRILDPTPNVTAFTATIQGQDAFVTWAVLPISGQYQRRWVITDRNGVMQASRPITFNVLALW